MTWEIPHPCCNLTVRVVDGEIVVIYSGCDGREVERLSISQFVEKYPELWDTESYQLVASIKLVESL